MRRGIAGPAAAGVLLLAAGWGVCLAADRARPEPARAARGAPCLGVVNLLALDLLWLRADALFAEDRRAEMLAAYEAAARLEPRLADAHEYLGFHLAYNLAGESADAAERSAWIVRGLRTLDEGAARNPRARRIRRFLAQALLDRSLRWPEVARALLAARGREPVSESIAILRALVEADSADTASVWALSEALVVRGLRELHGAPGGAPAPAADGDLSEAARLYRTLAAGAAEPAAAALRGLAEAAEEGGAMARGTDAAARRRYLEAEEGDGPGGASGDDRK